MCAYNDAIQLYTDTEIALYAYTAGFLDGEGCIRLRVQRSGNADVGLHLSINQVNPEPLVFLQSHWGGSIQTVYYKGSERRSDIYIWHLYSAKAANLCRLVLPFLHVKTEQAKLAVKFQNTIHANRRPLSSMEVYERNVIKDLFNIANQTGDKRIA